MSADSGKAAKFFTLLFLVYFAVVMAFEISTEYRVFCFACIVLILWAAILWAAGKNRRNDVQNHFRFTESEQSSAIPVIAALIVILTSAMYWLAYFPGFYNLDADGQWLQAHGILNYNDWHPITSTLIMQLFLSICDRIEFYIVVQIILFSLSVANIVKALEPYHLPAKVLLGIVLWISVTPAIGLNTISVTKDVQFTILIMNLTACMMRIIQTDGAWISVPGHTVGFSVLLGLAALVRHNGILYVFPVILLLLLSYKPLRCRILTVVLLTAALISVIKGPASVMLNVEPHDNAKGEIIGIPMAIMGNALVNDPENLPDDVHRFLNRFASDTQWRECYITGEWDSCKWEFNTDEALQDTSLLKIFSYTWKTVVSCPQTSYDSFRLNTRIVWDFLFTHPYWIPEEYIAPNEFGIVSGGNGFLHSAFEHVKTISLCPVLNFLTWNTGFHTLAILLIYCISNKRMKLAHMLLILPLEVYNGGTMLLLAGPNQRYFYCNAVLFLPIALSLFCEGLDYEENGGYNRSRASRPDRSIQTDI